MKNLKDLKPNEAIRVSKEEWPKLAELLDKAGFSWIQNGKLDSLNPFLHTSCASISLNIHSNKELTWNDHNPRPNDYPASDFIRPEPKFKVGDHVIINEPNCPLRGEAQVKERYQHPETGNWSYYVTDTLFGTTISEEFLLPVEQYEIGKEYEFSMDGQPSPYFKGKLVAIINNEYKYVADVPDVSPIPVCFRHIRPIQPKEITIKDVAGLLRDWYELHEENVFGYEPKYLETVCNLVANTGNILQQLK